MNLCKKAYRIGILLVLLVIMLCMLSGYSYADYNYPTLTRLADTGTVVMSGTLPIPYTRTSVAMMPEGYYVKDSGGAVIRDADSLRLEMRGLMAFFYSDEDFTESGIYLFAVNEVLGDLILPLNASFVLDIEPPESPRLLGIIGGQTYQNSTSAEVINLSLEIEHSSHLHYNTTAYVTAQAAGGPIVGGFANTIISTPKLGDDALYTFDGQNKLTASVGPFYLKPNSENIITIAYHDIVNNELVENITIYHDSIAPELTLNPSNNTVIGSIEGEQISAIIQDLGSGVNVDSISLSIDGVQYNCGSAEIECSDVNGDGRVIEVILPDPEYKKYEVTLSVSDNIGIAKTVDWEFEYRTDVPARPTVLFDGGFYIEEDNKHYVSDRTPSFDIIFENDKDVEITFFTFANDYKDLISEGVLQRIDDHSFRVEIPDALILDEEPNNQAFELMVVRARKLKDEVEYGAEGRFEIGFVVDVTPPSLISPEQVNTNQQEIDIDLIFDDKNIDPTGGFINVKYFDDKGGQGDDSNATIESDSEANYKTTLVGFAERLIELQMTICDKANNCDEPVLPLIFDGTPPTVWTDYQYNNVWASEDQGVLGLFADDGTDEFASGVDKMYYCTYFRTAPCDPLKGTEYLEPISFTGDQNKSLVYQAVDNAGNPSEIAWIGILIDSTPPIVIDNHESNEDWYNTGFNLTIEASDDTSGLAFIRYCIGQGCYGCGGLDKDNAMVTQPGSTYINYCVNDSAGNNVESEEIINIDLTPPSFEDLKIGTVGPAPVFDQDVWKVSNTGVVIIGNITTDYAPIARVYAMIGGSTFEGSAGSNNEFEIDVQISSGTNEVVLMAVDMAGNTDTETLIVEMDTAGPQVAISQPAYGFDGYYTNQTNPEIIIETDEAAECTLEYSSPALFTNPEVDMTGDSYEHRALLEHSIAGGSPQNPSDSDLTITCVDGFDNVETFTTVLHYDPIKPEILEWESTSGFARLPFGTSHLHEYLVVAVLATQLRVEANEPVRCRYTNITEPVPDYYEMENEFGSGWGTVQLSDLIEVEDGRNYTFHLNCVDQAGNIAQHDNLISHKTIGLDVNISAPVEIAFVSPEGWTNNLTPKMYVETYQNASCSFKQVSSLGVDVRGGTFSAALDFFLNLFEFSHSMEFFKGEVYKHISSEEDRLNLEDNTEYEFDITCEDRSGIGLKPGRKRVKFRTKQTIQNPEIIIPEYDGITLNTSEVTVTFTSEINTTVKIYINIYDPAGEQYQDELFISEDNPYTSRDLLLDVGENIIFVEARDLAGNVGVAQRSVFFENFGPNVSIRIDPSGGTKRKIYNITAIITVLNLDDPDVLDLNATTITLERISDEPATAIIGQVERFSFDDITHMIRLILPEQPFEEIGQYRVKVVPRDIQGESGLGKISIFNLDPDASEITWIYPAPHVFSVGSSPVNFAGFIDPLPNFAYLTIDRIGYNNILAGTDKYPLEIVNGRFNISANIGAGKNRYTATAVTTKPDGSEVVGSTAEETIWLDIVAPIIDPARIIIRGQYIPPTPQYGDGICDFGEQFIGDCIVNQNVIGSYEKTSQNYESVSDLFTMATNPPEKYQASYNNGKARVSIILYPSFEGVKDNFETIVDNSIIGEPIAEDYIGNKVYTIVNVGEAIAVVQWVSNDKVVHIREDEASAVPVALVNSYLVKYPSTLELEEGGCLSPDDCDGDGMPDTWEDQNGLDRTDPTDKNEDPDADGLTNFQEYNGGVNPTDPNEDDSDNDGMKDGWEVQYTLDPNDSFDASCGGALTPTSLCDKDEEGLNNLNEHDLGTNPLISDTDGDGFDDFSEFQLPTDPLDNSSYPQI